MFGDLSAGTFRWGIADHARLLIMLSARKTALDLNTECIEVNSITEHRLHCHVIACQLGSGKFQNSG